MAEPAKKFSLVIRLMILFFVGTGIFVLFAYLTGEWLPHYDLAIAEMGVCRTNSV